jgi:hypothetical protein
MMLSDVQFAYLAGLIDGEGSITCQKEVARGCINPRYILRVEFTFGTREPLATICQWLGIAMKTFPPRTIERSSTYRAAIQKSIAIPLLQGCIPYMILKKRQAELMLEIEAIRAKYSPDRHHHGSNKLRRMPPEAIEAMENRFIELRSLKCNKRKVESAVHQKYNSDVG